jgi:hypothetical protein
LKTTFVTLPKGGEVRDTQTLEPKIGIFMGLFNSPPFHYKPKIEEFIQIRFLFNYVYLNMIEQKIGEKEVRNT